MTAPRNPLHRPFVVDIPEHQLSDLRERLARTRLPDQLEGAGWEYGTERGALERLLDYWRDDYDWRVFEARLNEIPGYTTRAEGERLHFLHLRSPEADAIPLVLVHGWPGSIAEFVAVAGPLADPKRYAPTDAKAPAPAFHVVIPSMPGYGFSGPTTQPGIGPRRIALAVAELMEQLGYRRYVAQGGDWGAVVVRHLAQLHPERLLGVHFNMLFALPEDLSDPTSMEGVSPEDLARFAEAAARVADGTGYMDIQGTRPQTLAYGLNDSPAGLAAWIFEKFHAWTDFEKEVEEAIDIDRLLDNITLYWLTGTINSSMRLYREARVLGEAANQPWKGRIEVPTGVARYPRELLQTPRAWADRQYDIVHWADQPRGGHFAAFEQPELFVEDLRAFGARLRG